MPQRILVLESDDKFATELRAGFMALGAEVEVVPNGTVGLERVEKVKPDLILLSAELTGLSGWLVCNKIRKKADLKAIPLVVMSSAETARDTFDKHRELPTRADDYVKKPISFDDLVDRVVKLGVSLDGVGARQSSPGSAAGGGKRKSVAPKNVDAEIDAFADEAFDNLVMRESPKTVETDVGTFGGVEEATGVSAPPVAAATTDITDDAEFIELDDDAGLELEDVEEISEEPPAPPPMAASPRPKSERPAAVPPPPGVSQAELDDLARKLQAAEARAEEAERLAVELKVVKSQRPAPAVSSREFLDLREQLNTKDRELLDLKDQVTAREKELLDFKNKNLELERAKADFEDKIIAAERESEELREKLVRVEGDRDVAAKRANDAKERAERAQERIKQLEDELEGGRAEAQAKLAALEEKHATQAARNASAHAAELDALKATLDEAVTSGERAREEAVAAVTARFQSDLDRAASDHAGALQRLKDEHSADVARRVAEAESSADARVAEVTARHAAESERVKADAAAELEQKLGSLRAELEAEKAAALQKSDEKHSKELALVGRKLTETEARLDESYQRISEAETERDRLKADLDQRAGDLDTVRAELAAAKAHADELGKRLRKAESKMSEDAELLDRARRAFAIGISLLEDQRKDAAE